MSVAENLQEVKTRIAEACARAGCNPAEVTLVAVTKTHGPEMVKEAMAAGHLDFGENYVQELREKYEQVDEGPRWHYIGHLQRNKVKYIAPWVHMVHTVDSLRLAEELDKRAGQQGRKLPILIQVNVAGEDEKSGCEPDEALTLVRETANMENLELRGLMTMPPFWPAEQVRPFFRQLRELRNQLQEQSGRALPELSMGMTADFEAAIEEGATIVRVGTAVFGAR